MRVFQHFLLGDRDKLKILPLFKVAPFWFWLF